MKHRRRTVGFAHHQHSIANPALGMHHAACPVGDDPQACCVQHTLAERQNGMRIVDEQIRRKVGIAVGFVGHQNGLGLQGFKPSITDSIPT